MIKQILIGWVVFYLNLTFLPLDALYDTPKQASNHFRNRMSPLHSS